MTGNSAWRTYYPLGETAWKDHGLKDKLRAFVEGGANFIATLGVPFRVAIGIVAVLVASFAATTLDTATRLQRYVIQELAGTLHIKPFTGKYAATGLAVGLGGAVALFAGFSMNLGPGKGGLVLWPLFGATNQLLAGLAFMVIVFYLWRRNKPIIFAVIPMIVMLVMPAWAMIAQIPKWIESEQYLLVFIATVALLLEAWMIVEAFLAWPKAKGVLEEALPPLETIGVQNTSREPAAATSGPNC